MKLDILLIWLIITPLFFAFGWLAGRIDMKTVLKHAKQTPKRIYDSIDALIDNKTAIAADELKQVIEQEPQLFELTLSLGSLYRKRGENDLAIKLHTKLLNSQFVVSTLDKEKLYLELAQDFQKAGLIDRAEELLLKLQANTNYANYALEMLLLIYQQDKSWSLAIDTAKKLATSDISFHTELAQFNCELGLEAMIKSNFEEAGKYLNQALSINRKCVRANILLGEVYFNQEKYIEAINTWQLIEKQNYLYLTHILDKLFEAYLRLNQIKEGLQLLKGYATLYPTLSIAEIIYQKLIAYENDKSAILTLRHALNHAPNAKTAAILIEMQSSIISLPETKADAEQIKGLLLKYHTSLASYRCGCCNFKSKTFFWQCPACYSWESISPNKSEN